MRFETTRSIEIEGSIVHHGPHRLQSTGFVASLPPYNEPSSFGRLVTVDCAPRQHVIVRSPIDIGPPAPRVEDEKLHCEEMEEER